MPKSTRTLRLQRLQGRLGDVAYELTKVHFSAFHPGKWRPAINAYRCAEALRICVDLAGVDRSEIELELKPRRLTIRGRRELPEPDDLKAHNTQVLAREIDSGAFEREISLPLNVESGKVSAEQTNGMLWIHLPLRHH